MLFTHTISGRSIQLLFSTLLVILIVSCTQVPGMVERKTVEFPAYPSPQDDIPPEWMPSEGDDQLEKDEVFLEESQILISESYPLQYRLTLTGSLPTPCHELRVSINDPDGENRIHADVYSVVQPDKICVQVLESIEVTVSISDVPEGQFSVWVNGEKIAEISP